VRFSRAGVRVDADALARGAGEDDGMKVAEVMSRDVITVVPSTPLKDVARLLVDRRIAGLPVVDDEGRVLGVVSETDIVIMERGVERDGGYWLFGPDPNERLKRHASIAAEAMTCPPVTIGSQQSVRAAARLMIERAVNRLPVVDDGRLVGIVTRADLVRAFGRADEDLAREINDDVLVRTLWIDPGDIVVSVREGAVALGGEVDTRTDAELARTNVERVPGVVSVDASELSWRRDDVKMRYGRGERRVAP
jgi:CBS domain-containing protein